MKSSTIINVITYVVAAIAVIVFAFPFYWLITTSFKFDIDIYHYPPVYIPFKFTFHNYWTGLFDLWGLQGIRDSFIISAMNTILVLALSIPAAYALALMPVRGKNFLMSWILSQRMLPPIAVAIPFFLVWKWLGWLDTYQALVLTYTIFNLPFAIWLLAGYIEELPREVYEAALVDGASHLGVLKNILLPLIKPSIAVTSLFTFIFSWNEFLFAVIFTREKIRPFTVVIPSLIGGHVILWGAICAVTLVGLIPEIVMVLLLQKHIVRGLTLGAIKG